MSGKVGEGPSVPSPFLRTFDGRFAARFMRHLKDEPAACTGCGEACNRCRAGYKLDFSDRIAGVHIFPDTMLTFVDDPGEFLPAELPQHEVAIAINVHQDVLLAIPELAKKAGAKALIVPVENPDWMDRWVREELAESCAKRDLEFASPKPFCALEKGQGETIEAFIDEFKIGRTKLKLRIEEGVVRGARVLRSAPCGYAYFVAHEIIGMRVGEELMLKAAKLWHSFPCTASMKTDAEFNDSILHRAGHILYEVMDEAVGEARLEIKD